LTIVGADLIPVPDGAGEALAVGAEVTRKVHMDAPTGG